MNSVSIKQHSLLNERHRFFLFQHMIQELGEFRIVELFFQKLPFFCLISLSFSHYDIVFNHRLCFFFLNKTYKSKVSIESG